MVRIVRNNWSLEWSGYCRMKFPRRKQVRIIYRKRLFNAIFGSFFFYFRRSIWFQKKKKKKTKVKTKSTILIKIYVCFKRHTQATSGTIFDGEVPLSRKLRQMRSSSNLSLVSLRSNFHFRKLRNHQPRKHRKLYKYLSAGSASTCPQRWELEKDNKIVYQILPSKCMFKHDYETNKDIYRWLIDN